ncbi:hypothetical protein A1O1_05944 [Capronia coronata CBS 617.96]|uniref:Uncharacterized protein n=1 Tax=Capronia coronata CBS 617.96 TaxID=1182541 RepID=W9YTG7_9EURO|nr:uncharacterized protein A1O1_05944 [Capronia coronata CBS 617.96]EXJ85579.1 hypothetical protein A1O1_05944 [Capronia coronata CBS 617.96]
MSSDAPSQLRSADDFHIQNSPTDINQAPLSDNYQESFIDIAALAITFLLMTTFIAILLYAWRKRCDGRRNACRACHTRQHSNLSCRDDDLEDIDLVFDDKDVVGKQD